MMKQLNIRMPDGLHRAVKVKAAEVGRSMNDVAITLLAGWVWDDGPLYEDDPVGEEGEEDL